MYLQTRYSPLGCQCVTLALKPKYISVILEFRDQRTFMPTFWEFFHLKGSGPVIPTSCDGLRKPLREQWSISALKQFQMGTQVGRWQYPLVSALWVPSFHGHVFSHHWIFSSLLAGIFSAAYPALWHTPLPYPRTHGHTVRGHCGCSIGLSPDILLWPRHLPGGDSLRCSCTQPWSPPCTLCQTPFHSWGPQEAHRKELVEEKNVMSMSSSRMVFWEHIFIFPLPWGPNKMTVKTNKREKPHNRKENGKINRGDEKKKLWKMKCT